MRVFHLFMFSSLFCLVYGVTRDERIEGMQQAFNNLKDLRQTFYKPRMVDDFEYPNTDDLPSTSRDAQAKQKHKLALRQDSLALHHIVSHADLVAIFKKFLRISPITQSNLLQISRLIIDIVITRDRPEILDVARSNWLDFSRCLEHSDFSSLFSFSLQIRLTTDEEILTLCKNSAKYIYQTLFYHLPFNLASGPVQTDRALDFESNIDMEMLFLLTQHSLQNHLEYDALLRKMWTFLKQGYALDYLSTEIMELLKTILVNPSLGPLPYDPRNWETKDTTENIKTTFSDYIRNIFRNIYSNDFETEVIYPRPLLQPIYYNPTREGQDFINRLKAEHEIKNYATFLRNQRNYIVRKEWDPERMVNIRYDFVTKTGPKRVFFVPGFLGQIKDDEDDKYITTNSSDINEKNHKPDDDDDDDDMTKDQYKQFTYQGLEDSKHRFLTKISRQYNIPLSQIRADANNQKWEAVSTLNNLILPIVITCFETLKYYHLYLPQRLNTGITHTKNILSLGIGYLVNHC